MAQRAPKPAKTTTPAPKGGPTRAEVRAKMLAEIRAKAEAEGAAAAEKQFPTSTPLYELNATIQPMTLGDPPAPEEEPIEEGALALLAHEINKRLTLADRLESQSQDHRLAAAIRIAEAKKECETRHMNWRNWAEAHIPRSFVTVKLLATVGAADDPAAALAQVRAKNTAANIMHRALKGIGATSPRLRAPIEVPPVAPVAPPVEAPQAAALPTPAVVALGPPQEPEDVMEEVMHRLMELDTEQRRLVADTAAVRLPAEEARAHVETVASKLGLEVVRDGSTKFFATVETMLAEFDQMQAEAQARFLRLAAEHIGALVELQDA